VFVSAASFRCLLGGICYIRVWGVAGCRHDRLGKSFGEPLVCKWTAFMFGKQRQDIFISAVSSGIVSERSGIDECHVWPSLSQSLLSQRSLLNPSVTYPERAEIDYARLDSDCRGK
jgi:hypothetical protein